MGGERFFGSLSRGAYLNKDQGGVSTHEQSKGPIAMEDHLAAVALEALSISESDPDRFKYDTKIGVARAISARVKSGDPTFLPRTERTLPSHIYRAGAFLRDMVQADIYQRKIREEEMENLTIPELLASGNFTGVPNKWRAALTKLSETLPEATTVGQTAAVLMFFAESSTAGDTIQERLGYASTQVDRAFGYGPRTWWGRGGGY